MGESTNGFGLSWEQLLIAGIAFAVLIGVVVAAFRGSGRGKRDRAADGAGAIAGERRAPREPPTFTAAGAGERAEPSLGRAAAPKPPPPPRPQPAPIKPVPPVALAPEPEPMPEPEPVPSFLVPPRPAPPAAAPTPSPAAAEPDPALEDLKSEVEELRQANAILKRRVEETERTLIDMQTEIQAKFASLERTAAKEEPAAKPKPLRPPPPLRFSRSEEPAPDRENDLERARRAIELLSRKDEDAS